MPERIELTPEGKANLEAELQKLVEVDEPETLQQMSEAASQGDLRENFAYHDARRELGLIRGRIAELRQTLSYAIVIAAPKAGAGIVQLGTTVTIAEDGYDDEEEFVIVSEAEGGKSRKDGKTALSVVTPLGGALIGKKLGEKASYVAPNGSKLTFKIVKIN